MEDILNTDNEITKILNEKDLEELKRLEEMRQELHLEERRLRDRLLEIEKECFKGKAYREYVISLKIKEIIDNIEIDVNGFRILAYYPLDGVTLTAYGSVWEDGFISVSAKYPTKTLDKVPHKYAKEEKHLLDVCNKYRVVNPVGKIRKQYGLDFDY